MNKSNNCTSNDDNTLKPEELWSNFTLEDSTYEYTHLYEEENKEKKVSWKNRIRKSKCKPEKPKQRNHEENGVFRFV